MITTYLRALRLFSRDVRLLLITAALNGFCYFGIYVVLFNLYLLRLGYGPEFIGLVNAAALLALAVFGLPAGALGRRWGSRRIMIVGLSLMVAGYGLPPLVEFIPIALRSVWLLTTYSLSGLGAALYMVNGFPFLMGATGLEERNYAFSVQMALMPLGGFAGNLVGGLLPRLFATTLDVSLDQPAPYRYPLLITGVLLIPAVLAMLATREGSAGQAQGTVAEEIGRRAPFGLIAIMSLVMLLRVAGEGATRTFFNVYLDASLHVSTSLIGTLMASSQLLAGLAALTAPLLMARWGKSRTVVLGTIGMALSMLPLALIPHWEAAGLSFIGIFALASITGAAFTVYQQESVSPGWRTVISGAANMALGLSWSTMAFGGGYMITALGYRSLFLTGAGLTAGGALLFWAYFQVPRGELARRSAPDKAN